MQIVRPKPIYSTAVAALMVCGALLCLPEISFAATADHGVDGAHGPAGFGTLIWPVLNFILYSALMVYGYKKLARPALKGHAAEVQSHLSRAAESLGAAEQQYESAVERQSQLSMEKKEIIERLTREGERIAEAVLEAAQRTADQTRQDVSRRIDAELKKAQAEVRAEVIRQASARARTELGQDISPHDDWRLRQEALLAVR